MIDKNGKDYWKTRAQVELKDLINDGQTTFNVNVLKNSYTPPRTDALSNITLKIEPSETIVYTLYGDIFRLLLPPVLDTESDSQTNMQVKITEQYLILLCSNYIFFIKLSDIDEQNNKKDFIVKDWELNKLEYVDVVHLEGRIPANVLDLNKFFDDD